MTFYRILMTFLLGLMLLRRGVGLLSDRGRAAAGAGRTAARGPLPDGTGPLVWVHGASNGELTAARALMARFVQDRPVRLLITTNSETARGMVSGWGLPRTAVRLAPLDHPWLIGPLLDHAAPVAHVILENELWPERLTQAARRGLPVLVLGGRMSARSARLWGHAPRLARRLMAAISWLAPQDDVSRRHFLDLGLPPQRIGPTILLKALSGDGPSERGPSPLPFSRAETWLAASTHEGEEEIVLDAFCACLPGYPALRLILAPRHPRRRDRIERLIAARDLTFATRSRTADPGPDHQVYLADTMGEMALWYRAAGMTFVGGSLADHGGHTPFEPAAFGSAILHGPSLANFAAPYRALDGAGGAVAVTDRATLATAIARLAGDSAEQARLAAAARTALSAFAAPDPCAPFLAALDRLAGIGTSGAMPGQDRGETADPAA